MAGYPPGYQPPYQPAPQQNSTTAIISLIAGIAGLTIFPVLGSIVAVILGHMAKSEIARSGGALGGSGAATFGLVLGYIGLALLVLGLCLGGAFVLFPLCAALLFSIIPSNSNGSVFLLLLLAA